MTCLQTCPLERNAATRSNTWSRLIVQSFADLWIAILYASVAGFAILAIDASDGGRPSLAMWALCLVVPPVTASVLIVLDALVRITAERR